MDKKSTSLSRANWQVLILFGIVGQIAWAVENMYFNLFVFETVSPNLSAITLMVQLSGIVATVTTHRPDFQKTFHRGSVLSSALDIFARAWYTLIILHIL